MYCYQVSAGGFEPPTLCLKGRCSTPELRALKNGNWKYKNSRFLFQAFFNPSPVDRLTVELYYMQKLSIFETI
jgi:hypothetical protein